jgi:hypothetical protein
LRSSRPAAQPASQSVHACMQCSGSRKAREDDVVTPHDGHMDFSPNSEHAHGAFPARRLVIDSALPTVCRQPIPWTSTISGVFPPLLSLWILPFWSGFDILLPVQLCFCIGSWHYGAPMWAFAWFVWSERRAKGICLRTGTSHDPNRSKFSEIVVIAGWSFFLIKMILLSEIRTDALNLK